MSKRKIIATFLCAVFMLLAVSGAGAQDKPKSLTTTAKGKGMIKVGREQFPLYTVVLKLKEGGDLEMTLVSDITLYFEGTWSAPDDVSKGIDLKIGSGATGGTQGGGKVFLRSDGKSIDRMTLKATNKFRKTIVDVNFSGE
jgi:hypothetical protein